MKLRSDLKKEIIRLTSKDNWTPDWVIANINTLVDKATEKLEKSNADTSNMENIYIAAWLTVNECH